MRTGWRIILTIVVVAILLGAICFGVGLLTGASPDRILQSLNSDYHLNSYVDKLTSCLTQLMETVRSLF